MQPWLVSSLINPEYGIAERDRSVGLHARKYVLVHRHRERRARMPEAFADNFHWTFAFSRIEA